jgi:hypothetical protein
MRVAAIRHGERSESRREEIPDLEIGQAAIVRDVENLLDEGEAVAT